MSNPGMSLSSNAYDIQKRLCMQFLNRFSEKIRISFDGHLFENGKPGSA